MVSALVLDPGESTGAALVSWGDDQPLTIEHTMTIVGDLGGFISWFRDLRQVEFDMVICELFEIDGTITGTWSPRIEGALSALWGGLIVWQRRDEKARLLPDEDRRRAWFGKRGHWFRTSHELDAATHGLVYVAKTLNHLPTVEAFWPKPAEA